jgi:geranylgeranyl pyrophosphate synthase
MFESLVDSDFAGAMARVRAAVEGYLEEAFDKFPPTEVLNAARYSVLGGGRRWRPIVAVAAGRIFRPDALDVTLPGACGIELAHAASLVLDDLPSMDDAKVRRGKACTHLVFPAWAVDLAPVFMITMAYQISLNNPRVSEERRVRAALEISAAGLQMIAGQSRDVVQAHAGEGAEGDLLECYELKTGVLYATAAKVGAILCGATDAEAQTIYSAGMNLGLSFQLLDDVADAVDAEAKVGASACIDAEKWTAIDWLGVEGAVRESRDYQSRALSDLRCFGTRADWLSAIVREATAPLARIRGA